MVSLTCVVLVCDAQTISFFSVMKNNPETFLALSVHTDSSSVRALCDFD